MDIDTALKEACQVLSDAGITEPRRDAGSLLAHALKRDPAFLIAHPEYRLSPEEKQQYTEAVRRRVKHEPIQYIAGKQEFYGLEFKVSPNVLIPRPETELIVENALRILRASTSPSFCEVGIGSGCISVAVLANNDNATAVGLDISPAALNVAKRNAAKHGVSERLELYGSDVFSNLSVRKFDLIVSNPPYVPDEDIRSLQIEVRDFEPYTALSGGETGLNIIEKLVMESPRFLNPDGYLLMEIGFNQSPKVAKMFAEEIWESVECFDDLQGIPRMLKARLRG